MRDPFLGLVVIALFLCIHGLASWRKWYYRRPEIDVLTHFLGGASLGVFIKEAPLGLGLIFLWELFEALLVKEGRRKFRESPMNKVRDLLAGLLGFLVGVEFL